MENFGTVNAMSPFNMELLMTSIANNDKLVRSYHEKCAENTQIQQNLNSITDTAEQIQQMYKKEKEHKEKLLTENADLMAKLRYAETQLEAVENDRINKHTLNQQTIAELEEQLENSDKKYFDVCALFVEQMNILNMNNLASVSMLRKCTAIKDILQNNGIQFEWNRSPSKQKSKSTADKVKSKSTRTFGTQTDNSKTNYINLQPKKDTCEKSTQYQQSKTTRSTCTSAFIHKTEMSTNTDPQFDSSSNLDGLVESVLDKMRPIPDQLSPIYECFPRISNSTQTIIPKHRTQGTLTTIHNVRKRINYVPTRTKSNDLLYDVKKEETRSPCPSPHPSNSNVYTTNSTQNGSIALNADFHHLWRLVGDILYHVAGQRNVSVDDEWSNDMQLVQKIYEIQNMIGGKAIKTNPKSTEINDTDNLNIDYNDDSRDSIESYDSSKIEISQIRNLSNCSPMPVENVQCTSSDSRQTLFRPIASSYRREYETELNNTEANIAPLAPSSVSPSPSSTPKDITNVNGTNQKGIIQREQCPSTSKQSQPPSNECQNNSKSSYVSEKQNNDDAHFKVPKRKIPTGDQFSKRRKTVQVSNFE